MHVRFKWASGFNNQKHWTSEHHNTVKNYKNKLIEVDIKDEKDKKDWKNKSGSIGFKNNPLILLFSVKLLL